MSSVNPDDRRATQRLDRDGDGRADAPRVVDGHLDEHRAADRPVDARYAAHRDPDAAYPVSTREADERRSTFREEVVEREKERFGGIKFGSAFFGWLTATGTAVLLTALVAALGAALGLGAVESTGEAADAAAQNAETIGIVGAIALAVILFVAYFAGGYVAGRMARFDGAKQGLAVWLWAVIIAIVVAVLTAVAGSQFNILAGLNSFPRIPLDEGALTVTGIVTAILVALVSLGGAILGGVTGMRFHRRVDRAGLGD